MCNRSLNHLLRSTYQSDKNGPQVLSIGYGTTGSDEERVKVFDRAVELDSIYFDSASVYSGNEDILEKYFNEYS